MYGGVCTLVIGKIPVYNIRLFTNLFSLLSLELGRPQLIKEEDCNASMPSPIDDQYISEDIDWATPTLEQSTSPLLPMIQVIGGIAKLLKMLKLQWLNKVVLHAYDSHFNDSIQAFPAQIQVRANEYLDPVELPPLIYLQNARLTLFRNNLNPSCETHERSTALDKCSLVARDTARLLSRCMQDRPSPNFYSSNESECWEARMISAVSAFMCTHIWRCTLYLCSRSDWENALWCTRASATIGDARPVNTACGRYLEFFLFHLLKKQKQRIDFDNDEDTIAYASGDLQGSFQSAWIWQAIPKPKQGFPIETDSEISQSNEEDAVYSQMQSNVTSGDDGRDWGGWNNVLNMLEKLFRDEQEELQRQEIIQNSSLRPPLILPPLMPSPSSAGSSNRMSIRDLI